jgi:predicted ATPase/class 3 adenylate cyclase
MTDLSTPASRARQRIPSGTVTFLFTDIEGSTKLAQQYRQAMPALLARHNQILHQAIEAHNGYVFQVVGDSFAAAFHFASDALHAAAEAQRNLQNEAWTPATIKVRMGIHTGAAQLQIDSKDNPYSGYATIAATQRVMSAGYGGQILISGATRELVRDVLPTDTDLLDLGEKRLKDLLGPEHIYQLNVAGLPTTFPQLKTLDSFVNNLPLQLTTFIGREKEIEQIKKRLEKNRLVTLTGSGGVGKTRLSIQIASELLSQYPNGGWLVELAPITDPALVAQAVCNVLDITLQGSTSPLTVLTEYLHSKKLLLVVDNCEHLIDTCAHLCDSLLHACPNLHIIASSREALGIDGENAYRVPSLSLPDPKSGLQTIEGSEAVKLFLERATAILPEFELTESNASFVAQICRRLDGIALAIELAASRVKMLKLEQIAARLDDVFRLLTGGSRTALPRQQTLRALIDWSYNLLSEEERTALRKFSIFMGGWTLEAAEYVGDNPNMLDLLTHLVDKSLVSVDLEHGDEPRYYLLETIRQYAREKLTENGESETIRNRHMEYFCQLVEHIEPSLRGPNQVVLYSLEMDLDNLRTALEWALDHNVPAGLRLAAGLKWLWHFHHHWAEGIEWLDKLLQAEDAAHSLLDDSKTDTLCKAKALLVSGHLTGAVGELQKATVRITESLTLCEKMDGTDWIPLKAAGYMYLGIGTLAGGDINQAKILAEKSLELSQSIGNKFGIAEVQYNLLIALAFRSREFETARLLSESILAIHQELGNPEGIAAALSLGGLVSLAQSDYKRAQKLFRDSIEASREMYSWGYALGGLGMAYLFNGEMALAHGYFLQAAKFAQEKWNPMVKASSVYWLAMYSFEQKQFRKFIQLNSFLETEKSLFIYVYYLPPNILETFQRNVITARTKLNQETLNSLEAEGKAMTLDQALAYALEGIDE